MAETFDQRLTVLEERVDGLADQQNATNERLDRIEGQLDGIDGRLDGIEYEQRIMRGQINNLNGSDYERRVVRRAPPTCQAAPRRQECGSARGHQPAKRRHHRQPVER